MNFLEDIFTYLEAAGDKPALQELRDGQVFAVTGRELLTRVEHARACLRSKTLKRGDRCALLAHNSIDWVALDLAMMAECLIVVPLYARQAPAELVAIMKDCAPSLVCCGDAALRDGIVHAWPEAPSQVLFEEIFAGVDGVAIDQTEVRESDA